jgi:hypothetical protein
MTSPTAEAPEDDSPVVFRASKKRKGYRQRIDHDDHNPLDRMQIDLATSVSPSSNPAATEDITADATPSVSEIMRLRRRSRLQGVEFRPESSSSSRSAPRHRHGNESAEQSLVQYVDPETGLLLPAEPEPEIGGISRRFAPQTGLTGELVNKHM